MLAMQLQRSTEMGSRGYLYGSEGRQRRRSHDIPQACLADDLYDTDEIPVASPVDVSEVVFGPGPVPLGPRAPRNPQSSEGSGGVTENEERRVYRRYNTWEAKATEDKKAAEASRARMKSREFKQTYQFVTKPEGKRGKLPISWVKEVAQKVQKSSSILKKPSEQASRPMSSSADKPEDSLKKKSFGRSVSFSEAVTVFTTEEAPKRQLSRLISLESGDYSFLVESIGDEYADLEAKSRAKESLQSLKIAMKYNGLPRGNVRGHRSTIS